MLTAVLLPATRSLEWRARYLFYCLFFFCSLFLSTISRQPAGRFTPKFACGRILDPDVSSPLLGVSGPRGGKRGKWNFRYYRSQWGIFTFWWFLSDISATPNFICVGTMSADVLLPPLGSIGPNGGFVSVLLTHLFNYSSYRVWSLWRLNFETSSLVIITGTCRPTSNSKASFYSVFSSYKLKRGRRTDGVQHVMRFPSKGPHAYNNRLQLQSWPMNQ